MQKGEILPTTQTFKFCENAQRKCAKKKQKQRQNNKNIRNGADKTMPP